MGGADIPIWMVAPSYPRRRRRDFKFDVRRRGGAHCKLSNVKTAKRIALLGRCSGSARKIVVCFRDI